MNTFEKTIVKIIDMKGKILHTQKLDKEVAHLNFSGADLSVGSYVCRIIQGNKEKNIQFVKS